MDYESTEAQRDEKIRGDIARPMTDFEKGVAAKAAQLLNVGRCMSCLARRELNDDLLCESCADMDKSTEGALLALLRTN
jgi:hypothetical protein